VEGVELLGHTGFIGAFAFHAPDYDAVLTGTHSASQVDRWPLVAALCRELRPGGLIKVGCDEPMACPVGSWCYQLRGWSASAVTGFFQMICLYPAFPAREGSDRQRCTATSASPHLAV
jgi:hypothetical protein